ncbi:MBL fold metallo-hydrolase [Candidatus Bathyarchaeota archaeon]|nr:MBL fold metallo-hydrolase [Candidatus Bathyarchaeota archaeon]MBS7631043.1 MBL fold metallo-hydrolase [Candidatus Bathyarchaeota archaeon]
MKSSKTVLLDPHDGSSLGLKAPVSKPDIVLITHPHNDHAGGRQIFENHGSIIVDKPYKINLDGVNIIGVRTFHDDVQGAKLGENIVYVVDAEGVKFCHLGDIGHILTPKELLSMANIEVLFVSTGRNIQLAEENIERVKPKIVIPMHYHINGIIFPYFPLLKIEDFVKGKPNVRYLNGSVAEYHKEKLPSEREIHVFKI